MWINLLVHAANRARGIPIICVLAASASAALAPLRMISQTTPIDPLSKIAPPPSPTVRGVVVSDVDGTPIPRAEVKLRVGYNFSATVFTDEDGRFEIPGVQPGTGYMSASKPGFLTGLVQSLSTAEAKAYKQVEIGQSDVQVQLAMTPEATIAGHIRNEAGEPVNKLPVCLLRQDIGNGLYVGLAPHCASTDNEGAYRLQGIEPGTYILQTGLMADTSELGLNYFTVNSEVHRGYVPTYYPGVGDAEGAKAIKLVAGERAAIDWNVARQRFPLVIIPYSADIIDEVGDVGSGVTDAEGVQLPLRSIQDHDHHRFGLYAPKGNYTFQAIFWPRSGGAESGASVPWKDGSAQPYYGIAEFTVQDQPMTLPEMPLQHPVSIPIHMRTEFTRQDKKQGVAGRSSGPIPQDACFSLWQRWVGQAIKSQCWRLGDADKDHSFKDVVPGSYIVQAGTGNGTYLASLTCGKVDLMSKPLDVRGDQPACSIEAVFRDDMASVELGLTPEGLSAMTAVGKTTAAPRLIPLDEPSRGFPFSDIFFRASNSVKFSYVAPGTYLAIISDEGQPMVTPARVPAAPPDPLLAYRDPKVQKRLMTCGKAITVSPGEQLRVLVDWCPSQ
jgi:hypothetical protein